MEDPFALRSVLLWKGRVFLSRSSIEEEKNAFYVVRKGDVVGAYTSSSDCQAQVGSSVSSFLIKEGGLKKVELFRYSHAWYILVVFLPEM